MGVTLSGPLKANSGVRSDIAAARKVLEGDDQQIYVHYITIWHYGTVGCLQCFYAFAFSALMAVSTSGL